MRWSNGSKRGCRTACARCSRYLRQPQARLVRVPAAVLLMLGGVFSILPVLGIWMLPLGLLLLAVDLPALRPPLARVLHWIERKWPGKERAAAGAAGGASRAKPAA